MRGTRAGQAGVEREGRRWSLLLGLRTLVLTYYLTCLQQAHKAILFDHAPFSGHHHRFLTFGMPSSHRRGACG